MELIFVGGLTIKKFSSDKSCFIWPFCERGEEKVFCLKTVNNCKLLQQNILWLSQILNAYELKLLRLEVETLDKYSLICSSIIHCLNEIRTKKNVSYKMQQIVDAVNKSKVLSHCFEKLLWQIAKKLALNCPKNVKI